MNRFAKSLTGIKGVMVKECSSESRIFSYNFRIFQVKYWFRLLIFCRKELDKSLSKNTHRTDCQQITSTRWQNCLQSFAYMRLEFSRSHWLSLLSTFDFQFQAILPVLKARQFISKVNKQSPHLVWYETMLGYLFADITFSEKRAIFREPSMASRNR